MSGLSACPKPSQMNMHSLRRNTILKKSSHLSNMCRRTLSSGIQLANNKQAFRLSVAVSGAGFLLGLELWRQHREPTRSEEAHEEKPSPESLKNAPAPGNAESLPFFSRLTRMGISGVSIFRPNSSVHRPSASLLLLDFVQLDLKSCCATEQKLPTTTKQKWAYGSRTKR
jgi:hypothetical protein